MLAIQNGMFGLTFVQLAITIVAVIAIIAFVVIFIRVSQVQFPPWLVQLFWVALAAVIVIAFILFVSRVAFGAPLPTPRKSIWSVVYDREEADRKSVTVWAIKNGNVVYMYVSNRQYAELTAKALNKRNLGPYWHYGRQAQEVIDIQNSVSDEVFQEWIP